MTARDERAVGAPPGLPAAVELLTAMSQAGPDPEFFWAAVARVMAESTSGDDLAGLVFAQTALAHILLRHLADATGEAPEAVLARLASVYTRPVD